MDNNNTILLDKIRDVLSTLSGTFTSDLAIIKAKLEGISDLIIIHDITTDTDTIEFNTDLTEKKLCKCKISFSHIQTGSGTPAPDNVCPISGYDYLSVAVLETHEPEGYIIKEIEFDNTVLDGDLDIISGSGTITHGYKLLNGTEAWTMPAVGYFALSLENLINDNNRATIISNRFLGDSWSRIAGLTLDNVVGVVNGNTVRFHYSACEDLASWKTWLGDNNTQICYELATPTAITTTPEDITTIEGDNVISTNKLHTSEDINTTGIEVCYFETVNNYFKNKEI